MEETRSCEFCGVEFVTKDKRKRFCTKRHADRARNRVMPVRHGLKTSVSELSAFRKLDDIGKQDVLLGKAGFTVAMFDIEATHLKPNVGRMICCSIKPIGEEPYTFDALERRFKKRDVYDDSALAITVRDELEKYDIIVGWNSKNFDTKFINSRCVRVGARTKVAQYQVDGMWSWRSKLNAWSGLNAAQQFAVPDGDHKTSIAWEQWMRVIGWDPKLRESAMDEIIEHCELDVRVLEDVYTTIVNANMVRSLRRDGGIL